MTSADRRIAGPAELVQAVPYLLGFRPAASLVLVGLADGTLVVTARLDLADADAACLAHTVAAMREGGTVQLVALVYPDRVSGTPVGRDGATDDGTDEVSDRVVGDVADEVVGDVGELMGGPADLDRAHALADLVRDVATVQGCAVLDVVQVHGGRWRSLQCEGTACCPPGGRPVLEEPSPFAAAATVAGVAVLGDRAALERQLDAEPDERRAALTPQIELVERRRFDDGLRGEGARWTRSVKRALFAAARAADQPGWPGLGDDLAARFAVALADIAIRDAVWMAIDNARLDGRPLWRALGVRLPSPYDSPALFLFGWASWRAGNGALASIAAHRAVAGDAGYSAADLLLAALSRGVDPRRLPRLRLPRSA